MPPGKQTEIENPNNLTDIAPVSQDQQDQTIPPGVSVSYYKLFDRTQKCNYFYLSSFSSRLSNILVSKQN